VDTDVIVEADLNGEEPCEPGLSAGLDTVLVLPGQSPIEPGTDEAAGDFVAQFRRSAARLATALQHRGSRMRDVLRAEIHITEGDADRYGALQAAFLAAFPDEPKPARCVTAVRELPGGAAVQLGAIAARHPGIADPFASAVIASDGPAPCAPFPHARVHGGAIWATAQIGSDPASGSLAPVPGGAEPQLVRAIDNLDRILRAAGGSLASVVQARVQYVDGVDPAALAAVVDRAGWPLAAVRLNAVPFIPTAQAGVLVKVDAVASVD
jgi:enamine deaminase RidA (YjgF/YER057c/UK114 family)